MSTEQGTLPIAADVGGRRLTVAVTGSSGLIGSMLRQLLSALGHQVVPMVRRPALPGEIRWDPAGAGVDPGALEGVDAVVNLAGESIAGGRWTAERKRALTESRTTGTRLLAEAMARAPRGPLTLVSASAIGYYGERGAEELTESSPPGIGFLPALAQAWEDATAPAREAGVRVVRLRIGLVLTPAGGLLHRMLLPFRLGLGGRLGDGRQWMSWISSGDLMGAFYHALTVERMVGPVNAVAPGAVRNTEFTAALAAALHRPAVVPVPKAALRLLFGQMADEAILASARVLPVVLQTTGYRFQHETLEAGLGYELGGTSHV